MANLITLLLVGFVALMAVFLYRPDGREALGRLVRVLRPLWPWAAGLAALGALVALAEVPVGLAVFVTAIVLFAYAWLRQFTFLMQLADDAFPGRFDKLIWAFVLIVLPPVGLLTFWSYREAHWPSKKSSYWSPAARELS